MTNTVWAPILVGLSLCLAGWFSRLNYPFIITIAVQVVAIKNCLKMLGDLDVFLLQHHADVQLVGRSEVDLQILDLGRS